MDVDFRRRSAALPLDRGLASDEDFAGSATEDRASEEDLADSAVDGFATEGRALVDKASTP